MSCSACTPDNPLDSLTLSSLSAGTLSESVLAARASFPAGLFQPEGTFRFSQDALLLADFAARLCSQSQAVADLGAGCGVVGLAYWLQLCASPVRMVGIDINAELAAAAQSNAQRLGFGSYFMVTGDITDKTTLLTARQCLGEAPANPPLFDTVLCNPPWRKEGAGRVPPEPARRAALFGHEKTLATFFQAADILLQMHGSLFTIAGADRLADAVAALPSRLRPVRVCFVHSTPDAEAVFFMMQAIKGSGAALRIEPPLFLRRDETYSPI